MQSYETFYKLIGNKRQLTSIDDLKEAAKTSGQYKLFKSSTSYQNIFKRIYDSRYECRIPFQNKRYLHGPKNCLVALEDIHGMLTLRFTPGPRPQYHNKDKARINRLICVNGSQYEHESIPKYNFRLLNSRFDNSKVGKGADADRLTKDPIYWADRHYTTYLLSLLGLHCPTVSNSPFSDWEKWQDDPVWNTSFDGAKSCVRIPLVDVMLEFGVEKVIEDGIVSKGPFAHFPHIGQLSPVFELENRTDANEFITSLMESIRGDQHIELEKAYKVTDLLWPYDDDEIINSMSDTNNGVTVGIYEGPNKLYTIKPGTVILNAELKFSDTHEKLEGDLKVSPLGGLEIMSKPNGNYIVELSNFVRVDDGKQTPIARDDYDASHNVWPFKRYYVIYKGRKYSLSMESDVPQTHTTTSRQVPAGPERGKGIHKQGKKVRSVHLDPSVYGQFDAAKGDFLPNANCSENKLLYWCKQEEKSVNQLVHQPIEAAALKLYDIMDRNMIVNFKDIEGDLVEIKERYHDVKTYFLNQHIALIYESLPVQRLIKKIRDKYHADEAKEQ